MSFTLSINPLTVDYLKVNQVISKYFYYVLYPLDFGIYELHIAKVLSLFYFQRYVYYTYVLYSEFVRGCSKIIWQEYHRTLNCTNLYNN